MHDPQRRRLLAGLGAAWAAASLPLQSRAAKWPERPAHFIVPFPPGGPGATTAPFTTQPMSEALPVPVVADNQAGGGGIGGAQSAAMAEAEGAHNFFASIRSVSHTD